MDITKVIESNNEFTELIKITFTGMWFTATFGFITGDCCNFAFFCGGGEALINDALLGGNWGGLSGTSLVFGFWYKSSTCEDVQNN